MQTQRTGRIPAPSLNTRYITEAGFEAKWKSGRKNVRIMLCQTAKVKGLNCHGRFTRIQHNSSHSIGIGLKIIGDIAREFLQSSDLDIDVVQALKALRAQPMRKSLHYSKCMGETDLCMELWRIGQKWIFPIENCGISQNWLMKPRLAALDGSAQPGERDPRTS